MTTLNDLRVATPPATLESRPEAESFSAPYKFFGTFRLLLALAVFFSHSHWLLFSKDTSLQINKLGVGGIAVMAFFVLSGYIISEASATFYRGRPFPFLLNRLLRLLPPISVP